MGPEPTASNHACRLVRSSVLTAQLLVLSVHPAIVRILGLTSSFVISGLGG